MTAENAERGRQNVAVRWDRYKAERIAAGLPPTKRDERAQRARYLPPSVEPLFMDRALRLGLADDNTPRAKLRAIAKRLAEAEVAVRVEDAPTSAPVGDDELLAAHYFAEVTRWRQRAERDRAIALEHDRYAEQAEAKLTTVLYRMGRL